MQKPMRTYLSAAVAALIASSTVQAGGFSLYTEGAGYTIGNYAAGAAAEAADASTGWYNPAGLALIRNQQSVFGGVGVFPSSKLDGTSTFYTSAGLPAAFSTYRQSFNDLDGGVDALVPSFHYARPIGENATVGLSVVSPFGLSTEWSRTSPVRYAATFTELLTTNVSPEIGGFVTDNLSLGLGIDLQYSRVKFNSVLGVPTLSQRLGQTPFFLDSPSYNKGDSFGVGFHGGALAVFNENHTRIGINYQSRMNHRFNGFSRLRGPLATPGLVITSPASVLRSVNTSRFYSYDLFSNETEFPEIITLSGYHDVNDRLALLGSVVYTGWHTLRYIQLNNVAAFVAGAGLRKVSSTSSQNYDNAWRFAIGANYRFTEQFMLRVGGGYDETPTNDVDRDVRLADVDRWAASIGGHYQWRPDIGFDLGYTYLKGAHTTPINKTQYLSSTNSYTINATGKAVAHLVGAQLVWTMDAVAPMPMPTK